jgi:hypothetical protein
VTGVGEETAPRAKNRGTPQKWTASVPVACRISSYYVAKDDAGQIEPEHGG